MHSKTSRIRIKSLVRLDEKQAEFVSGGDFTCGSTKGVDCTNLTVRLGKAVPNMLIVEYGKPE